MNKECYEVPLINPITGYAKKLKPLREATFGVLLPFGDNLLVTYSSEVIYILDPISLVVIATISHLRRYVNFTLNKNLVWAGFEPGSTNLLVDCSTNLYIHVFYFVIHFSHYKSI